MIILPYHDYYPHQWEFFKNCVYGNKLFAYCRWARRAGKDDCFVNALSIKVMEKVGLYAYILPNYEQVRKTIWENVGQDGNRFIDYFPNEIVSRRRENDMTIIFANGSILKFVGSDNYSSLRGWNPIGIIQAEYQDHRAQSNADLLPIIAQNGGFMWKNSVHPETRNHAYDLWENVKDNKDWHISQLNWHQLFKDKAKTIPIYTEKDKATARIQMKSSEIDTNFEMRLPAQSERYIYSSTMNAIREQGQVLDFHLDTRFPVHTYWDLGVSNVYSSMAVWVIQDFTDHHKAVAYFEGCGMGVIDYIEMLKEFATKHSLILGEHFCPHDGQNNKDYFEGKSLIVRAKEHGVTFKCPVSVKSIKSGIQNSQDILTRTFFHKTHCQRGLQCLENYQRIYNVHNNVYGAPMHDEYSHGADAFRYFAQIKSREELKPTQTVLDRIMTPRNSGTNQQQTQTFRRSPSGY